MGFKLPSGGGNTKQSLDQIAAANPTAADWSNNNHKITSVSTPTLAGDAATKGYVDGLPGSALTLLATQTLVATGAIDISGISQAYNDLIIVAMLRGASGNGTDHVQIVINADATGANYDGSALWAEAAGAVAVDTLTFQDVARYVPDSAATAGRFGMIEILIAGYTNTNWHKSIRSSWDSHSAGTAISNLGPGHHSIIWKNTAAITEVKLQGQTNANFLANSTMRIYGRL